MSYQGGGDLLASVTSPDQIVSSFSYAGARKVAERTSGFINSTINLSYDSEYRLSGVAVQGGAGSSPVVGITYDNDHQVTSSGDIKFFHNNVGAISGTSLGTVQSVNGFNNYGEVISEVYSVGNKNAFSRVLTRDKIGRVTSVSETEGREEKRDLSYIYDQQGRLVAALRNGKWPVHVYKYDPNGNRIEAWTERGFAKAQYDAQDRLIKYGKSEYKYNNNGDLVQKVENKKDWDSWIWGKGDRDDQKITSYSYDAFGNLKSVILPNKNKIEYIVDGQNRRIGKKVNGKLVQGFVYQSQTQIAAELDSNGNLVKRFVYGSKSNVPDYMVYQGKEYRIISNQVGTPKLVIDVVSGRAVEELSFDEFGVPRDQDNKSMLPFGFAGGLYDRQTGLVKFGARDYDPETGRWTSKDPILFRGGDTNLYGYGGTVGKVPRMETNLYGYALQDPINFIDPTGLYSEDWVKDRTTPNQQMAVGAAAAAAGGVCLKAGYSTLDLPLILTGLVLGYEGAKNVIKARERGAPELPGLLDTPQ